MMVTINDELLYKLVDYAADMGSLKQRIEEGKSPEFVNQSQANARYGRGNVARWVKAGLVKRYKDADGLAGSGVRYSAVELHAAAFKCNCIASLSQASKDEMAAYSIKQQSNIKQQNNNQTRL